MIFPTLYKRTATGATQQWDIAAEEEFESTCEDSQAKTQSVLVGGIIITRFGQVGGAIQETRDLITEGKNLGKQNATTPFEQACAEAKAAWTAKLKKGYVKTEAEAEAGVRDEIITGGVDPMLAHKYKDHGDKIVWPAYCQPKLDGIRCLAIVRDGKCTLWTRTRKPITSCPHIIVAIEELAQLRELTDICFDGELYNHTYKADFEKISGAVRKQEPTEHSDLIQYHIYDLDLLLPYTQRLNQLSNTLGLMHGSSLFGVQTALVADEVAMFALFDKYREWGYEGLMVRSAGGCYEGKRSYGLLKVKEKPDDDGAFEEAEFEIIGAEEGRGKLMGHVGAFVCKLPDGQTFNAPMNGKQARLKEFWENPTLHLGKSLTVRFQGYTVYGVPRFPKGLHLRDYE